MVDVGTRMWKLLNDRSDRVVEVRSEVQANVGRSYASSESCDSSRESNDDRPARQLIDPVTKCGAIQLPPECVVLSNREMLSKKDIDHIIPL